MSSPTKQVKLHIPNLLKLYTDGTVHRLWNPPTVSATLNDAETGVSSKDITLSTTTNLTARLYLPKLTTPKKLPIILYFHGGGFLLKSAFSAAEHRYMNILAAASTAMIVSVEYRLAPEHPLPAAYDDAWEALNSLSSEIDPWLTNYGDLNSIFIGGDSAGGNIAHNTAIRAGSEPGPVKIKGIYICHAFFLGPKRVGPRNPVFDVGFNKERAFEFWEVAYPGIGPDNPMIDPVGSGGSGLRGLGCEKVLVVVGEKDDLFDWEMLYYNGLKESGFNGSVELIEIKGEGHSFQVFDPTCDNAKIMINGLASFFNG